MDHVGGEASSAAPRSLSCVQDGEDGHGFDEEFQDDGSDSFFGDDGPDDNYQAADDSDEDPDYFDSEDEVYPGELANEEESNHSDDEEEDEGISLEVFNNEMEDFHQDLKAAHGFKRISRKGGRHVGDENYSFEVKSLLGQANQSFVGGDSETAMGLVKQIIRIEPTAYPAWKIMGEIFNERQEYNRCLLAWLTAAHAKPSDWELWMMCAQMSHQQYGPEKQTYRDQAIYCYNRAISANSSNIEAIYERSLLLKEVGQLSRAVQGFVMLNRLLPNDMAVLKEIAELYIELGRVPLAIEHYVGALEFFQSTGNKDKSFGWGELNIMAELYYIEKQWTKAIQIIKSVGRWLYGRNKELYWDQINGDDREWDTDDKPRRCLVREFKPGKFRAETYILPLELRVKLGLCRLRMGNSKEALVHFEHLKQSNAMEYNDLYQDVADALSEAEAFDEAIHFYAAIVQDAEYLDRKLWINMANCYKGLDKIEDAEDCYTTILDSFAQDEEAMLALAGIYEMTGRKLEALDLVNEVIKIKRSREAAEKTKNGVVGEPVLGEAESMAFVPNQPIRQRSKPKRPGVLTVEERAAMNEKMIAQTIIKFKKLENQKARMEAGDPEGIKEWLDTAGDLVDDFRNTRALYPHERSHTFEGFLTIAQRRARAQGEKAALEKMASRLKETLTFHDDGIDQPEHLTKFRGLDFDTWLYIFMQYAICLAKYENYQDAYDVCNAAKEANVFYHNPVWTFKIWITWLACAMLAGDSESCSTICRWFMTTFQFHTEAYSLFIGAMTASKNGLEVFHNNANQKYLLRQIKAMDEALTGEKRVGAANLTSTDVNGEKYIPRDIDVGLLMLYGHILASGKSYISALNYYTRAYAALPNNPMITFCIGLAYIHRSMQRQSENRHMQVLQGMTFLFEYYDLRTKPSVEGEPERKPEVVQEAEYNIARAFHTLGLTHLAIKYYERVLKISDDRIAQAKQRGEEEEEGFLLFLKGDLKWEAAYNLQMIYVTNGNPALAKKITETYLVL